MPKRRWAPWCATDDGTHPFDRRPEVRILGRSFQVKAEIVVLNGLSSHADHPGLLKALAPLASTTRWVRLVHGEPDRAEKLAEGDEVTIFLDVRSPA